MEASERDSTQDWIVPREAVPTVAQLDARIGEALTIARASEEAVHEVGEMALEAARQALRAAEAAEGSAQAAVAAGRAARPAGPVSDRGLSLPGESSRSSPPAGGAEAEDASGTEVGDEDQDGAETEESGEPRFEVRFRRFSERADRVSARLRALEDHPRHQSASPVGPSRRRG
jgi:hypothetical protein